MEIKLRLLRGVWIRGKSFDNGAKVDVEVSDATTLLQFGQADLLEDPEKLRFELESILKRRGNDPVKIDARILLQLVESKIEEEGEV